MTRGCYHLEDMKDQRRQGKMLEHIKVSSTSNMGHIYDTFVEKKQ